MIIRRSNYSGRVRPELRPTTNQATTINTSSYYFEKLGAIRRFDCICRFYSADQLRKGRA